MTNSQNGGGETEYTEVGGVRVPIHMLSSQRGQPPVQRVNIAQPPVRVNNPLDPFNFLQPHISRQLQQAGPALPHAPPRAQRHLPPPPRVQTYAPPPYPPPTQF